MLEHFGIKDFIDIFLVASLLYYLFKMVKISGMRPLFIGIVVFLAIWLLVSRIFEMVLLGSILDQFVNIGLILLVILFQDEIRRFLMSLGSKKGWKFVSKLLIPNNKPQQDTSYVTSIVLACMNLSKSKIGALIVVQGDLQLSLYEQTGEIINADISSRLIENIFFKNSPLHDGAMIVVGKKIKAAGCILPISQNPNIPKHMGLRHRAGLGITQETDAKVIIVSEETGKITFAQEGRLKINVNPEELQQLILAE
ncbi:diadenylate cyclase CdaA [Petrimonas sp.]|uniref:diadenylate cyclase CdaA n=1 Tax=Petrimonas sp. TaxID=2023866 RepID=UPI003F515C00